MVDNDIYERLLQTLITYHETPKLQKEFDDMIYPYKKDMPIIIISEPPVTKVFKMVFWNRLSYHIGDNYQHFFDLLEKDELWKISNDKWIGDDYGACLYCHGESGFSLVSKESLCEQCSIKCQYLDYGPIIPIIFRFTRINLGVRQMIRSYYMITGESLDLYNHYDNDIYEHIKLIYWNDLSQICKITLSPDKCTLCESKPLLHNYLCNDCYYIYKEYTWIRYAQSFIIVLYYFESLPLELRQYIISYIL